MRQIKKIDGSKNIEEISEICHQQSEPVLVCEEKHGGVVVMSMETYERQLAPADLNQHLAEAKTQGTQEIGLMGSEEVYEKLKDNFVIE